MRWLAMWRLVATAGVVLACDRGADAPGAAARSAADAPASASVAPAASNQRPSDSERWPPKAEKGGQEFTIGIVDYVPGPREVALLTDVRAARHDGYDRVVFEFGSGAPPGYHLEYIDKPVRKCGSGDTTPIAGDGWLEVRFEPANAHTPSGAPTIAERDQKLALEVVKELEQTCDFEAHVSWVLGVRKPNKYRVLRLNDPLRLAVDVQH